MPKGMVPKGAAETAARTEVLQGTLDLMVLQTLETLGPQHGYAIAARSRPDPDRNIINKHMSCAVDRILQKLRERGLNLF